MADVLADFVRDQQRTPEPVAPIEIAHDDGTLVLDWTIAYTRGPRPVTRTFRTTWRARTSPSGSLTC